MTIRRAARVCPDPESGAMGASEARMAKRRGHAASRGLDGRGERPATGPGQTRAARRYQHVFPPLTAIVWPVTKAASSLARYTAAQPTSSGLPQRAIGTLAR